MRAHETLERAGRQGGFPARGSASGLLAACPSDGSHDFYLSVMLAFREPWGAPFAPWQAFDLTGAVLADLFLAWALLRGDGGAPGPDYR